MITAYIRHLRPSSTLLGGTGAIGALFAVNPASGPADYAILFMIVCLAMGAGFYFNDIFDQEKDRANNVQSGLIQGIILPDRLLAGGIIMAGMAVLAALSLGVNGFLLVSFNVVLLFYYSRIRFWNGIFGNFITSYFGASVILLAGCTAGWDRRLVPPVYFIFFLLLIREFIFDIKDVAGDRQCDLLTLPIKIGAKKTARLVYMAGALLVLSMVVVTPLITSANTAAFLLLTSTGVLMTIIPFYYYQTNQTEQRYRLFYLSSKLGVLLSIPGLFVIMS